MNTTAQGYHPQEYVTVRTEYPYVPGLGQRPSDYEVMEAIDLESLIRAHNEYPTIGDDGKAYRAQVFHRPATEREAYRANELVHCPNGY